MIRYDPFWKTLKEKHISQYMLTEYYEISSSTLSKMRLPDIALPVRKRVQA